MNLAQWIVTGALRVYQCVVSPVLHTIIGPFGGCRFHPTCSEYAREAIVQHGVGRGGWLTAKRICKCQPWGPCGHDPVPEVRAGARPSGRFNVHQSTALNYLSPPELSTVKRPKGRAPHAPVVDAFNPSLSLRG